jgi:Ca2+-binding EF-hand superfamily protein
LIFAGKQIKNSPKLPEPIFDPEEVALNQRILVALDSDKDGQVSFKEFVFGYQAGLRCHGFGDNLLPLFKETDLNGDKALSLEEISAPTDREF